MSTVSDSNFGTLLRRFRLNAQLSQEELGARANLSVETIGALERGARRAPYRTTVDLLARGLGLSLPELAAFEEAAARARARPRLNAPILSATVGNLPSPVTSFVGRDSEIRDLRKLLSEHRLVTITGTGGIGKTRTALQVGAELVQAYEYGVWFIELATIDAGATIETRIASALGLRLQEDRKLESLAQELRSRSLLLIIDNCEHLLESVASIIAVLLRECPRLKILATSRERLALTGEIVFRMPSLALPPADEHISVAQARSFAAIRLFLERAQLVDIRFSFEDRDVFPVLNICRRLDGVALAIEIAAARSQLGLGALEELICKNAITVSSDLRDVSSRHQTIAATITWSYRLLNDREQRILRDLSIFTGSFTVDAAVAICASDDRERSALPTLLEALCEKSLLNRVGENEPRFVLLQSIRDFASKELWARGEPALTAARHSEYYAAFADGLREKRNTLTRAQMIPYVALEIDNIDAAIERNLQDGGDAVVAARIMSGLRFYWRESGRVREAVRKATTLIERLDAGAYPALVASLHLVREFGLVGIERVNENLRAIELLSGVRDAGLMADAFMRLGDAYRLIKLATKARTAFGWAWTFAVIAREPYRYPLILSSRAAAEHVDGNHDEARRILNAALAMPLSSDVEMQIRTMLAEMEFRLGNVRSALTIAQELAAAMESRGDECQYLCNVCAYRIALGEIEDAKTIGKRLIVLARGRSPVWLLVTLEHIATIAALERNTKVAGRLRGFSEELGRVVGFVRAFTETHCYEIGNKALRSECSEEELRVWMREGAQLSEERAIEEALSALGTSAPAPGHD